MNMDKNCDCSCHPHNGLEKEQKQWQFGTIILGGKEVPCWCCWCHYKEEK